MQSLIKFFRTDVIWVALGQFIALVLGLVSLKIFTNLFSTEQYAYIALMMATSAWIWMGLYQPLNQTLFRLQPIARDKGWSEQFIGIVLGYEKKLVSFVLVLTSLLLLLSYWADKDGTFLLLIVLSGVMGVSYGCTHGVVSFFLAQRKRKPIMWIQSLDGLFRLAGGLAAYFWFSQTEYATASGMVLAGLLFFILVIKFCEIDFKSMTSQSIAKDQVSYSSQFGHYFKKIFLILVLNASIIHLDKWLLFWLMGQQGLGLYAVIYLLAMTFSSILYFFFETLGFPIVFNQQDKQRRRQQLKLLVLSYTVTLVTIVLVVSYFSEIILLLLTTEYIATQGTAFTLLLAACGILNLARLLMAEGQVQQQPDRYWSAYFVMLCIFSVWCLVFVTPETGSLVAAQGFVIAASVFASMTLWLNKKYFDGTE